MYFNRKYMHSDRRHLHSPSSRFPRANCSRSRRGRSASDAEHAGRRGIEGRRGRGSEIEGGSCRRGGEVESGCCWFGRWGSKLERGGGCGRRVTASSVEVGCEGKRRVLLPVFLSATEDEHIVCTAACVISVTGPEGRNRRIRSAEARAGRGRRSE